MPKSRIFMFFCFVGKYFGINFRRYQILLICLFNLANFSSKLFHMMSINFLDFNLQRPCSVKQHYDHKGMGKLRINQATFKINLCKSDLQINITTFVPKANGHIQSSSRGQKLSSAKVECPHCCFPTASD